MKIKKCFLIIAFVAVSAIALLYGVSPHWFAQTFLNVPEIPLDFAHILRAVMCLYLALGLFWLFSAFNDKPKRCCIDHCHFLPLDSLPADSSAYLLMVNRLRFSRFTSLWSLLLFQLVCGSFDCLNEPYGSVKIIANIRTSKQLSCHIKHKPSRHFLSRRSMRLPLTKPRRPKLGTNSRLTINQARDYLLR
jgi:hypothetical protein